MAAINQVHEGDGNRPALVMIHGLRDNASACWRDPSLAIQNCWPNWLGRDTRCDVWLVDYNAALTAWTGAAPPLPDQAIEIADLLYSEPRLDRRQLVLIGHSLGGLVIKTLLMDGVSPGNPKARNVGNRVLGVSFIATPHSGSSLASVGRAVQFFIRGNENIGNLARHEAHLRRLSTQFRSHFSSGALRTCAYAETKRTPISSRFWGLRVLKVMVVDVGSADPGLADEPPTRIGEADHRSICKPLNDSAQIHKSLVKFINEVADGAAKRHSETEGAAPTIEPSVPLPEIDFSLLRVSQETGLLQGPTDARLRPRERHVYGREAEIAQVLSFLRGSSDAVVITTKEVSGVGGIGKTEVCKAALKAWLAEAPGTAAYYVELPDRAGMGDLLTRMANAIGVKPVDSLPQLLAVLPTGLYYLDNLESVADHPEGVQALRALARCNGVRLLVSSRVRLAAVFGQPIEIGVLPDSAALNLFRDLWAGPPLPPEAELSRFVLQDLGAHALSVTLMARLGDVYGFAELQRRWSEAGAQAVEDPQDAGRLSSLPGSLYLTAQALERHAGALDLWTACAVFGGGMPEGLLAQIEATGQWSNVRPWLARHHVLSRREDRWVMLPPLARYALDRAAKGRDGFDWARARVALHDLFTGVCVVAGSIASTDEALHARLWLTRHFGALARTMIQEADSQSPALEWLQRVHDALINQYQFQGPAEALELLERLARHLPRPASAVLISGALEAQLGRPDEARALYERALKLYEREQNGLGQADTLKALGDLESRLGRPDEARALYERALKLYEPEQAGLGQANTLRALGDLESRLGRPDEARALYERALKLYEREQDGLGQANTLQALGDLESRLGRPDEARALYERALKLFEREQEGLGQANTLQALGDLESRLSRPGEARALYERALKLYEREQSGLGQANTMQSQGDSLREQRRFQAAVDIYRSALALYVREQDLSGTAYTLTELARCLHALHQEAERDEAMSAALDAGQRSGYENVARYVVGALVEIVGGREQAKSWLERRNEA